jgi:DNA polymerase I-like protein with 3'-5' exonuclease and polymerase domains
VRLISLDTETSGLDLFHSCRPFLVTIYDGKDNTYWPWRVNPKTRLPIIPQEDLTEIEGVIDEADEIVFQNAKYDIIALNSIGIEWREEWWDKVHDTTYSGHLLASGESHDLTSMALSYLRLNIQPFEDRMGEACKECRKLVKTNDFIEKYGIWRIADDEDEGLPSYKNSKTKKDEELGKSWKWDMWLPVEVAELFGYPSNHSYRTVTRDYANTDSGVTRPLWEVHKKLMMDRGVWKIYLERRKLIKRLTQMELRGITGNRQWLDDGADECQRDIENATQICLNVAGGRIKSLPDSGTTKEMRALLFDHWKLPVIKVSEKTGEPSVDKAVLATWEGSLAPRSPQATFIKHLQRKRQKDTMLGYAKSYLRYGRPVTGVVNAEKYFRLHSSINATGTAHLRMSSQNPNQQNVSKQPGRNLRSAFGPLPGREWWCLDYVNLELRLPAYEAGEEEMIYLFEHPESPPYYGSVHLLMFDTLHPEKFAQYGKKVKEVYEATWYQWTKNGDFAVQYGAIEESGTADAAYHVEGAQRIIQSRFTKIAELNQQQIDFAQRNGHVFTMPDKELGGYPIQVRRGRRGRILPTQPLNYHVSGTAMWCTCRAMARCGDYLDELGPDYFMTLQVHDELVFDFPKGETPRTNLPKVLKLQSLMVQSGEDVGVPLATSIKYCPDNWAHGKDVVDLATAV